MFNWSSLFSYSSVFVKKTFFQIFFFPFNMFFSLLRHTFTKFFMRTAYFHLLLHKFWFFFLIPTVPVMFEIIPFAHLHVFIWMHRNQESTCSQGMHFIFLGHRSFFKRLAKNSTLPKLSSYTDNSLVCDASTSIGHHYGRYISFVNWLKYCNTIC